MNGRWMRAVQWVIADGLELTSKGVPGKYHHNFDSPRRGWLSRFAYSMICSLNRDLMVAHINEDPCRHNVGPFEDQLTRTDLLKN